MSWKLLLSELIGFHFSLNSLYATCELFWTHGFYQVKAMESRNSDWHKMQQHMVTSAKQFNKIALCFRSPTSSWQISKSNSYCWWLLVKSCATWIIIIISIRTICSRWLLPVLYNQFRRYCSCTHPLRLGSGVSLSRNPLLWVYIMLDFLFLLNIYISGIWLGIYQTSCIHQVLEIVSGPADVPMDNTSLRSNLIVQAFQPPNWLHGKHRKILFYIIICQSDPKGNA